jgi:hypothetical protein
MAYIHKESRTDSNLAYFNIYTTVTQICEQNIQIKYINSKCLR